MHGSGSKQEDYHEDFELCEHTTVVSANTLPKLGERQRADSAALERFR